MQLLLDLCFQDNNNPSRKCKMALSSLLTNVRSKLSSLLSVLPRGQHESIIQLAVQTLFSFLGKLAWRFQHLFEFPYLWACLIHPAVEPTVVDALLASFF